MRIISGEYKSRVLKSLDADFRPASDRIRETLFNILPELDGLTFLDLFAGVGTVGLEAVSRGAAATFVERDRKIFKKLKQNIDTLDIPDDRYLCVRDNVFRAMDKLLHDNTKFSIIFAGPPYQSEQSTRIFDSLDKLQELLLPHGTIIIQESVRVDFPEAFTEVRRISNSKLGFIFT